MNQIKDSLMVSTFFTNVISGILGIQDVYSDALKYFRNKITFNALKITSKIMIDGKWFIRRVTVL